MRLFYGLKFLLLIIYSKSQSDKQINITMGGWSQVVYVRIKWYWFKKKQQQKNPKKTSDAVEIQGNIQPKIPVFVKVDKY